MKYDTGFGFSFEYKNTKTLGDILITHNELNDTTEVRQY